MAKSLFTDAHRAMVGGLIEARQSAGLFQADLAERVGKDQSYISNIERCQRRIDVVEFYDLAIALEVDPVALFQDIAKRIASSVK
ncbi:helix-turn-helix transcriptional regulator [Pseudomonas sp.]|uniref:helix-turn-helix domain-containing protein n=1 Tax=Pseudomonas sp. TaxID=306 RepID=UPI0026128585|nr:helix-turn-helix transcriptional regulator [Pseudomonas sp.]